MVGAIADGDRHTRAMSSDAAACGHLRRAYQQIFATSLGDGEATLSGLYFSLLGAGPSPAFCYDKKPLPTADIFGWRWMLRTDSRNRLVTSNSHPRDK